MVREFPATLSEVRQAVHGVAGDQIIHGTKVFDKDPILTGAEVVPTTPLFTAWEGPGRSVLQDPEKRGGAAAFSG